MTQTDPAQTDPAETFDAAPAEGPEAAPAPPPARRQFLIVVDDSPEMRTALSYACKRAAATGGRVALLRVVEPPDAQPWAAVAATMRAEARREAEKLLQRHARTVVETMGRLPVFHIREGQPAEQVIDLVASDPAISVVVLGATLGAEGPGPLVSYLSAKGIARLRVPVTVVPGGLSSEQIAAIA